MVDTFTGELKNSGYARSKAREIVVCGLLGPERKKKRRKREGQPFHRRAKITLKQRTIKKLNGKQSWFRNKPRDPIEEMENRKENRERENQEEKQKLQKAGNKEKKDPKAVVFVP